MRKSPDVYTTSIRRFFRDGTPPNGETPELRHDPQAGTLWDLSGPSVAPERIQSFSKMPHGLGEYASQAVQVIFENIPVIGSAIQKVTKHAVEVFRAEEKIRNYNNSILQ